MNLDQLNQTEQDIRTWTAATEDAEQHLAELESTIIATPEDATDMAQQIAVARETLNLNRRQLDAAQQKDRRARLDAAAVERDQVADKLDQTRTQLDTAEEHVRTLRTEYETRIAEAEATGRRLAAEVHQLERDLEALTIAATGQEVTPDICPHDELPSILSADGWLPQQIALDAAAAEAAAVEHQIEIDRRTTLLAEAWTILAPLAGDRTQPAANPAFESDDLATDETANRLAGWLERDKFTPEEIESLIVVARYAGYEIANVVATKIKRDRKAAAQPQKLFPEIVSARPGWDSTRNRI
jgi:hypothetical protein